MSDSQDRDGIGIQAVPSYVTTIPEINGPLSILLGQTFYETSHSRVGAESLYALSNRFTSPPRGIRILRSQEVAQPLHISDSRRRKDYLWHSGGGSSFSVPQLASHFSTSSAVACRPVA